jgi:5,10-methylenetetrahydrofolate reductase
MTQLNKVFIYITIGMIYGFMIPSSFTVAQSFASMIAVTIPLVFLLEFVIPTKKIC